MAPAVSGAVPATGPTWLLLLALVVPWAGAGLLYFVDGRRRPAAWSAVAVLGLALAAGLALLGVTATRGPMELVTGGWPAGVSIRLHADPLGSVFLAFSLLSMIAAGAHETAAGLESRAFPAILVLAAAGLSGLFLTGDLFNFYVFFEIAMVASFALAAHGGGTHEVRSATVFAVANVLGSAFFLGGIAVLYRLSGTLDLAAMAASIPPDQAEASLLAGALLFTAFGLKLGLFPFHFWLPPVYAGSRPAVAAALSGAVANVGSYGVLRLATDVFVPVLTPVSGALEAAAVTVALLGALSVVFGGVMAVSRRLVGEVLAYSAIGQVGYVLLAVAMGGGAGAAAAVVYAAVNALNKTLLFLTRGLDGRIARAAFVAGALSVAGVPPTAGFVAKVELFRIGVGRGSPALLALLVLGGALSLVYMFQAYQHVYWARPAASGRTGRVQGAVAGGLLVLIVASGAWPEPLLAAGRAAAAALGGGP